MPAPTLQPWPPDAAAVAEIPDGWTVYAFGDVHGVRSGLVGVLRAAHLLDEEECWIGGPRVALVGLGDYVDRGLDSAGVVALLRRLAVQMRAAGSRLVLVRGNHEGMLVDMFGGSDRWFDVWLASGGDALLAAFGIADPPVDAASAAAALGCADPHLRPWLLATLPYARWRDVLFVHAGLPAGGSIGALVDGDEQLWNSAVLEEPGLASEAYSHFRVDGVRRLVVGHMPRPDGPVIANHGSLLRLDADACGLAGDGCMALARLDADSFADSALYVVPTSAAVDRSR